LIKINLRFFFSCITHSDRSWQVCIYYLFLFFFLLIQSKDTVTDKRINRMNTSSTSSKSNDEEEKKKEILDNKDLHILFIRLFPKIKWPTIDVIDVNYFIRKENTNGNINRFFFCYVFYVERWIREKTSTYILIN
jgi:hypothetical protein